MSRSIAYVANIRDTACTGIDADSFVCDIINGRWCQQVQRVRSAYDSAAPDGRNAAKKAAAPLKQALPAVIWSGTFTKRAKEGICECSGYLVADIDDIDKEKLVAARQALVASQNVFCVFVSPTGTGLKVVFSVQPDPAKHQENFRAVAREVEKLCGLKVDESGKDISRLCFVSHDPEAYFNPEAKPLIPVVHAPLPVRPPPRQHPAVNGTHKNAVNGEAHMQQDAEHVLGPISWEPSGLIGYCDCPGKAHHTQRNTRRDCRINLDGVPTIYCFHNSCRAEIERANRELRRLINPKPIEHHPDGSQKHIVLPSGSVTFTDTAKQVFSIMAATKRYFRRGGEVVQIDHVTDEPSLTKLNPEAFRTRIENLGYRLVVWRKLRDEEVLKFTTCGSDDARAILASVETEQLPAVALVSRCPTLDPEGNILTPGYNPNAGGVFVTSNIVVPEVELNEAIYEIFNLFCDFSFVTPGDKARAIASVLTPAMRMGRLIPGRGFAPIDVAEAAESQSGKGYRHSMVSAIYGEQPYRIALRQGGVGGLDESIMAAFWSGRPIIQIDNIRGSVNCQYLESHLTGNGFDPVRLPYHGEVQVDTRNVVLQISSNGFEATQDLVNRSSICRIRKQPEGYQFRRYPEGDTLSHISANQPYYLGCVFAILRQWIASGKPSTGENRHSFRDWAGAMDYIVGEIMHLDRGTLLSGHAEAAKRIADPNVTWLRSVACELARQDKMGQWMRASELSSIAYEAQILYPGKKEPEDDARIAGRILSKALKDNHEMTVEEWTIERRESGRQDDEYRQETFKEYSFRTTV